MEDWQVKNIINRLRRHLTCTSLSLRVSYWFRIDRVKSFSLSLSLSLMYTTTRTIKFYLPNKVHSTTRTENCVHDVYRAAITISTSVLTTSSVNEYSAHDSNMFTMRCHGLQKYMYQCWVSSVNLPAKINSDNPARRCPLAEDKLSRHIETDLSVFCCITKNYLSSPVRITTFVAGNSEISILG